MPPARRDGRLPPWATAAVLIGAATLAVYWGALDGGFLWDDEAHIWGNAHLRSLEGLRAVWLELGAVQQYYPLTYTAWWLQYRLWGAQPFGYHAVNVALHALNAWLFWRLLRRHRIPGALFAALAFAVHPVHLESVAWLSELKNLLSAALALCALHAYESSREPDARRGLRCAAALGLFAAAMLSKTTACVMPVAALLLAWRERGRAGLAEWRRLAPFFAVGLALGLVTVHVERAYVGAVGAPWDLSALDRLYIAGRAYFFYPGKLLWPAGLSFVYPKWALPEPGAPALLPAAAAALSLLALWAARGRLGRGPATALLVYAAAIFPALGFFDIYPMRFTYVADHYQYLASLGPIALAAAAAARFTRRLRAPHAAALAAAALLGLGTVSRVESGKYESAAHLWLDTYAKNPESALVRHHLGVELAKRGSDELALEHLRAAERLDPDHAELQLALAFVLRRLGRLEESRVHYRAALRLGPSDPDILLDYGSLLNEIGRFEEAAERLETARRMKPDSPEIAAALDRARRRAPRGD